MQTDSDIALFSYYSHVILSLGILMQLRYQNSFYNVSFMLLFVIIKKKNHYNVLSIE